jgi:hypothetical protein
MAPEIIIASNAASTTVTAVTRHFPRLAEHEREHAEAPHEVERGHLRRRAEHADRERRDENHQEEANDEQPIFFLARDHRDAAADMHRRRERAPCEARVARVHEPGDPHDQRERALSGHERGGHRPPHHFAERSMRGARAYCS